MGLLLPLSAFSQLSLLMLKPSPRLRLMPTMAITTAMDWPTTGTDMLIMATTATRDLLMLSPRLMPTMAITMDMDWPTTDMDMLIMATTATLMLITTATTTARGLLT